MFQELEEVPMTMVGGFDVHRKQITFDYVDTDTGLVRCGEIRPSPMPLLAPVTRATVPSRCWVMITSSVRMLLEHVFDRL